jgi:hypothetical protein
LEGFHDPLFNVSVALLPVAAPPPLDEGVVSVLDHVLRPLPIEPASNVGPPRLFVVDHPHDQEVFLPAPLRAANLLVEVVGPSLPTLGVGLEAATLALGEELVGDFLPLKLFFALGIPGNDFREEGGFFMIPGLLDVSFRAGQENCFVFDPRDGLIEEDASEELKVLFFLNKLNITIWAASIWEWKQ